MVMSYEQQNVLSTKEIKMLQTVCQTRFVSIKAKLASVSQLGNCSVELFGIIFCKWTSTGQFLASKRSIKSVFHLVWCYVLVCFFKSL